jgi:hypothetical protein
MTDKTEDPSNPVAVAAYRADWNAGIAMSKADSAANVADAVLTNGSIWRTTQRTGVANGQRRKCPEGQAAPRQQRR